MTRQTITFVIDTNRDHDIIRWLDVQGNKSAAIREAIRAQLGGRLNITHVDIYEAIQDLKRTSYTRETAAVPQRQEMNEPPDIAAALDNMGL